MGQLQAFHGNFYPRPPRGGRRELEHSVGGHIPISIHALREEGDNFVGRLQTLHGHFYPRPPRGGRRDGLRDRGLVLDISIHALREEGDAPAAGNKHAAAKFLSTPSARRATYIKTRNPAVFPFLSTPSARRATTHTRTMQVSSANFYPRPPRGGRQRRGSSPGAFIIFLSTPSARRATCKA